MLAWDAGHGAPLTPMIVWQDKRQLELLDGIDEGVVERTGLPLDPYFSAGKLAWLRDSEPSCGGGGAGTLRMGTVDAFLADRLGARFATDLSTASRTQLLALGGPRLGSAAARRVRPGALLAAGARAHLRRARHAAQRHLAAALALHAQLVDQQAALAGSGAIAAGQAKATYGTGVFVLARTDGPRRVSGLLPTVAWADSAGEVAYALDGGVFTAGALLEWLAGELGLAADPAALAASAAEVSDSAGVMVLPALAGLGSPWWQPGARGVIAGLHGGVRPAHVARAALEAIAWRVADVVEAMAAQVPIERLLVDGGLANDGTLLQIQADALGIELAVGRADTTVQGAALLAGVGAGALASLTEAAKLLPAARTVSPRGDDAGRDARRGRWREFVATAARL